MSDDFLRTQLRQAQDALTTAERLHAAAEDQYREAVARLIVIFMAIVFVPVLVVSWLFELTPEGFRREQDVDHAAPARRIAARRLDRIIIVLLAIAVVYFAIDKFVLDPARDVELAEQAAEQARDEALLGSFGISLTKWTLVGTPEFIGLGNFIELAGDDKFHAAVIHTLTFIIGYVPIVMGIGLGLALLLKDPLLKLRGLYRVLLIIPWAVPNYVTALAWKGMFHRQFGAVTALTGGDDDLPLLYWVGVASSHLTGGVSAFSLRLPNALAAVALVLVTAVAGGRMFGASAGLWAGLAMATGLHGLLKCTENDAVSANCESSGERRTTCRSS